MEDGSKRRRNEVRIVLSRRAVSVNQSLPLAGTDSASGAPGQRRDKPRTVSGKVEQLAPNQEFGQPSLATPPWRMIRPHFCLDCVVAWHARVRIKCATRHDVAVQAQPKSRAHSRGPGDGREGWIHRAVRKMRPGSGTRASTPKSASKSTRWKYHRKLGAFAWSSDAPVKPPGAKIIGSRFKGGRHDPGMRFSGRPSPV